MFAVPFPDRSDWKYRPILDDSEDEENLRKKAGGMILHNSVEHAFWREGIASADMVSQAVSFKQKRLMSRFRIFNVGSKGVVVVELCCCEVDDFVGMMRGDVDVKTTSFRFSIQSVTLAASFSFDREPPFQGVASFTATTRDIGTKQQQTKAITLNAPDTARIAFPGPLSPDLILSSHPPNITSSLEHSSQYGGA